MLRCMSSRRCSEADSWLLADPWPGDADVRRAVRESRDSVDDVRCCNRHEVQHAAAAAEAASEGFNAGETIIGHVANSSIDHPLIHLPKIYGIDFSVTKHVFMIWLVAALLFVIVTADRAALHPTRAGSAGADGAR